MKIQIRKRVAQNFWKSRGSVPCVETKAIVNFGLHSLCLSSVMYDTYMIRSSSGAVPMGKIEKRIWKTYGSVQAIVWYLDSQIFSIFCNVLREKDPVFCCYFHEDTMCMLVSIWVVCSQNNTAAVNSTDPLTSRYTICGSFHDIYSLHLQFYSCEFEIRTDTEVL